MNDFTSYLQEKLQELTDYKVKVVEEVDFNYNPDKNEMLVVLKEMSGFVNRNITFKPFQLSVFTTDNEINYTKNVLDSFTKLYSNTSVVIGTNYCKQDYSTSIDMSNFLGVNEGFRGMLAITGSLLITESISDITSIYIDGKEINYRTISLTYSGGLNSQKLNSSNLVKSMIEAPSLTITINMYDNNDTFNSFVSMLRQGLRSPNDVYNVALYFTDNGRSERYICRIQSIVDNYDLSNPPTKTVSFVLAWFC